MKQSTDIFDEAFLSRVEWLVQAVKNVRGRKVEHLSPQIQYLVALLNNGSLKRLRYTPHLTPPRLNGDSGTFYFSMDQGQIRFSAEFRQAWMKMSDDLQLDQESLLDSFDNFILHEVFHAGQLLTTERHADIRHAQTVLRVLDYHADANAAIAAIILHIESTKSAVGNWQSLYSRLLQSVLRQIHVFDLIAEQPTMNASRFIRSFTWHYQYHRVSEFRGDDPFLKQQLTIEPAFSFRNLAHAQKQGTLRRSWPTDEPDSLARDKPHLWLVAPNNFGIPSVYRFLSTKRENYQALFDGVFTCDTNASRHFLLEVFNAFPDLVESRPVDSPTAMIPDFSSLLPDFKRDAWIDVLSDEGERRLNVRPALELALSGADFETFLKNSGLYFGWNKTHIDSAFERNRQTYYELRQRFVEKYDYLKKNYPPR